MFDILKSQVESDLVSYLKQVRAEGPVTPDSLVFALIKYANDSGLKELTNELFNFISE